MCDRTYFIKFFSISRASSDLFFTNTIKCVRIDTELASSNYAPRLLLKLDFAIRAERNETANARSSPRNTLRSISRACRSFALRSLFLFSFFFFYSQNTATNRPATVVGATAVTTTVHTYGRIIVIFRHLSRRSEKSAVKYIEKNSPPVNAAPATAVAARRCHSCASYEIAGTYETGREIRRRRDVR